ncbi:MAG TPA: hypothetical protein VHH94_05765, partial [Gammaproteobacteria bacterium]|nr:hypothetical protein [Gammaproteobacteria bacterium]
VGKGIKIPPRPQTDKENFASDSSHSPTQFGDDLNPLPITDGCKIHFVSISPASPRSHRAQPRSQIPTGISSEAKSSTLLQDGMRADVSPFDSITQVAIYFELSYEHRTEKFYP